jgi:hypothetical protein
MSQPPPQYPPASPPPGGGQPGGWSTPPGGQPPGGPGGRGPSGPERRRNTPLLAILAVVVVVAVGGGIFLLTQGGGGRSDEEEAYIDALTEASERDARSADVELSADDHRCHATAAVEALGVEEFRDMGTPDEIAEDEDLDPFSDISPDLEQSRAFYDSAVDCGFDFRDVFMGDIEEVPGITQEQIDCVNRSITDEILRDILVANFAENEEAYEQASQAADEATADCDLPGG